MASSQIMKLVCLSNEDNAISGNGNEMHLWPSYVQPIIREVVFWFIHSSACIRRTAMAARRA